MVRKLSERVQNMRRIKLERMILIGLLLLVVASFSAAPQEDSQVFTVCPEGPPACQFQRIQDAINASPDGATIQVRPGIYRENLFRWSPRILLIHNDLGD